MFYRRKIILALIQLSGGSLEKIRLHKLLFLYSQRKSTKPEYEFIPYKFGCFSYSLNADINAMLKKGFFEELNNSLFKIDKVDYIKTLKEQDLFLLKDITYSYGKMSNKSLIKHTYINYPFFATKSTIAKEILNKEQLLKVEKSRINSTSTTLFTIGYEGISLEKYLIKLLKADVKLLIDVRKNALSMKYGFSKKSLKKYCNSIGINYIHIPEVGIQSNLRQELNTQSDYDSLFKEYAKTTLREEIGVQLNILELLQKNKRIALTCFEANKCQCHRSHLAESIKKLPNFKYEVIHL